jgi:hypothetical protein
VVRIGVPHLGQYAFQFTTHSLRPHGHFDFAVLNPSHLITASPLHGVSVRFAPRSA